MTALARYERTGEVERREPTRAEMMMEAWLLCYTSAETRRRYRRVVTDWLNACQGDATDPFTVRRAHIDLYITRMRNTGGRHGNGAAPNTIANTLAALTSYYSYLQDEDAIDYNPAKRVRRPRHSKSDVVGSGLTTTDVRALADAAETVGGCAYALVVLLATSGLRIGEALGANAEDLSEWRGHHVLQVTVKGQTRELRKLQPPAVDAIRGVLAGRDSGPIFRTRTGRRMDEPRAWQLLRRLARVAGLPCATRIHPHDLRRFFATECLARGADLQYVQDALGHADPRTTRIYDEQRRQLDHAPGHLITPVFARRPDPPAQTTDRTAQTTHREEPPQ